MNAKRTTHDDEPDVSILYDTVREALFTVAPERWNPITISSWTYPMTPDGQSIQCYEHRKPECDIILYRLSDKDAFRIDMYQRIQFNRVREVYMKKRKRRLTKKARLEELEEAFKTDYEVANSVFPGCNVFMSYDLVDDLGKLKGMKEHPDAPEDIDQSLIAAAPKFQYRRSVIITVSKSMMDEDYTPYDMFVLVPMFSFVANKMDDDGEMNKVYEVIKEIYSEAIIVNSENWTDDAIENGMCGSAAKSKPEENKAEDWMDSGERDGDGQHDGNTMDTTPVKLGDPCNWGEQDNGDIIFTKEQVEGIDSDLKLVLKMTEANKWGILVPNKNAYKECLGLDYNIAYQSANTTYTISMMKDYDGSRFYVFQIFVDGKKIDGKIFEEKDFANYTLCKYRMNIVMQMFLLNKRTRAMIEASQSRKTEAPKRKTASKNTKSSRRKKS